MTLKTTAAAALFAWVALPAAASLLPGARGFNHIGLTMPYLPDANTHAVVKVITLMRCGFGSNTDPSK